MAQSHYDRESVIEGRVVNAKDSYSLHKNKTDNKFAYFTEDYVFYKVRVITTEDVNKLPVYNFEVDEDNSYCLPITAVHNCQGFSFAGKQLNFEDERSKLFFEFVRLLEETKPKYFLLENVRMKKEYQDVITEHLGVEPILINSSLVSAQNRERLYWTNIPNIQQPIDLNITIKDTIVDNCDASFFIENRNINGINALNKLRLSERQLNEKYRCLTAGGQGGTNAGATTIRLSNGKLRIPTPEECEAAQTVPIGYTDCASKTQRYRMLGNGWTVEVIKHIFKNIK